MKPLLTAVFLAIAASAAVAQSTSEAWQQRLSAIDADLKAGHYAPAQRQLVKLSRAIGEKIASGPQAMYTVGVVAAFRAIAEAGLKNDADAAWYWHVATSFYPRFAGSNLHVYGDAGDQVMRIDSGDPCPAPESSRDAAINPPRLTHLVRPKYPQSAIEKGIAQPVQVEVIVDENGVPSCPRIIDTGQEPVLAWALLEAMKQWRFEPATAGGKPVAAGIRETVDFRLRYY